MSDQDLLVDLSRRFLNLIDHPEPGCATWHIAVQNIVNQIAEVSAKLKSKTQNKMKTIRFTAYPDGYRCSEPGDQSGEYVKADDAFNLLYILKKLHADSTANDFNEHWESYTVAESIIKRLEAE